MKITMVKQIVVDGVYEDKVSTEFQSYTVISRCGTISCSEGSIELKGEETIYINKDIKYKIEGQLELIKSYV